jgi:protein SCO1
MTAGKLLVYSLRITLCAVILTCVSWAAPPAPPLQPNKLAVWPPGAGSPVFELVDTQGTPRTLSDYRGRIVVLLFGFMHCPDACPTELFKLALVVKQLGPVAAHVQVLFITLDPERDTPQLLKSYVSAFNPGFIGLTGTAVQVDRAASSFNVEYARVPLGDDYTISHSTGIFIVDGAGHLRLIGAISTPVADFAHDISALAAERP